jgi:putative nucleotidyltransferase with HDIG domain
MRRAARRIVEKLRLHGHEAFFAGGWVRDSLLRRKPQDIDIATSALPQTILELFPHSLPIGAQFGVVQVRMYGHAYDVVTFRTEGPYLDGRNPSTVTFAGAKQDAQRRDFTINGMFYDPESERVIDYVHGKADIQRRVVRTIGRAPERFAEDKLRMLRALRFACSLDFKIADETWEAIRQLAPEIGRVSQERIRDELSKILTGPDPARGLDLLHESGLLQQILPEVEVMRGVSQPPEFHPEGDVFAHTRGTLAHLHRPSIALAMAALLHDVGKPPTFAVKERIRFDGHVQVGAQMAAEICRRLRFPNNEIEQIVDLIEDHLRFIDVQKMRAGTLRRFLQKDNFADHLQLHWADCLSSHGDMESYHFCLMKLEEFKNQPIIPPRLIGGDDLIELGYQPGPQFRAILQAVEDLQLEGSLLSRDSAMEYVLHTFPVGGTEKL